MLDCRILFLNRQFDSEYRSFSFRCRYISAESDVQCKQDCIRAEVHRQGTLSPLYGRIRFGHSLYVRECARVGAFADKQALALVRQEKSHPAQNDSDDDG